YFKSPKTAERPHRCKLVRWSGLRFLALSRSNAYENACQGVFWIAALQPVSIPPVEADVSTSGARDEISDHDFNGDCAFIFFADGFCSTNEGWGADLLYFRKSRSHCRLNSEA